MVTVLRDRGDGRRIQVKISDGGQSLIRVVAPESREIYADLEQRYGEQKVTLLLEMLDELTTKLSR